MSTNCATELLVRNSGGNDTEFGTKYVNGNKINSVQNCF